MLSPKRTKYRKQQKGNNRGIAYRGSDVSFGDFGLQALECDFAENEKYGLAFLDISTGEFFIAEGDREYADKLLQSFKPAEVVFNGISKKNSKSILIVRYIHIL